MDVQKTREWVLSHPRIGEEERRLIFAALDSFETLSKSPEVTREMLTPIVEAARCRWVAVWDIGGRALAELAFQHTAAQEAFRELTDSRKSSERFQAISSLEAGMPHALLLELLSRGLNDRSKGVRVRAAMLCDSFRLREMLPELSRRVASESDAEVKQQFEFHADMIRDGFRIERKAGGEINLCVRARNSWSWQEITQEDIDAGRVPGLVAERQAKPY